MNIRVMRPHEVNNTSVREVERASIRDFVAAQAGCFTGRTLDFGCGLQPYRDIVEGAGGTYIGYDRVSFPGNISVTDVGDEPEPGSYDAILCNQVAQFWHSPIDTICGLYGLLVDGGSIVMTYPTTWAEVQPEDFWRFTARGMEMLLEAAGFEVCEHEQRAVIELGGFRLPLGYGVVAER